MTKHTCNTEEPTSNCCWTARAREMDELDRADKARIAKYGALSCQTCGQVYAVDGMYVGKLVVRDHASECRPITSAQIWG